MSILVKKNILHLILSYLANLPKIPKLLPKLTPEVDINTKITIWIVVCFALSILLYLSIFNFAGSFGGIIYTLLSLVFGRAAVIVPLGFMAAGIILFRVQKNLELVGSLNSRIIWGLIFIFGGIAGFLNVIFNVANPGTMQRGGGLFGYLFYPFALGGLGVIGGSLLLFCISLIGFFLFTQLTFVEFFDKIKSSFRDPGKLLDLIPDIFEVWNGKTKISNLKSEEFVQSLKSLNDAKKAPKDPILKPIPIATGSETIKIDSLNPKSTNNQVVDWKLPPFDILHTYKTKSEAGNVEGNKAIIKDTLSHFGISVEMTEAVTGPTVTQYTFKPANGVKLSSIDSLQRDLALALAVNNLRLEAPVSGKSLVGVEVPNKVKSQVSLRDLLQTQGFVNFEGELPVAIGKDVAGHNLIFSLSKMPHLLVAGATGAGKSIWINAMLLSLLYRYSPQDLKVVLVDMKRVELKLYEGVPHLVAPVITDAEKAINALKWTVLEMDRRYKLLEQFGKRNIKDYNDFISKASPEMGVENLPYMVFVIDELGDLMMLAKSEVEPIIVRLTQMSRAVGIHLVLGTQRPDIHVVTGLIKANVPTRIAFAVASQIDSRVILDSGGAEKLLGQGDGLIMSPSNMQPIRFQGPFVAEDEVRKCVEFLKEQAVTSGLISNLDSDVTEPPKGRVNVPGMSSSSFMEDEADDVFEEAKRLVIQYQKASTSFLQQMLGIGYPKAAKIIQQMEDAGLVGPGNGSKPRDVYINQDD